MKKKFKFIHKTGKVFRDERGYLLKILDKGFSSSLEIFSKKGSIRANHYHKKDEHFCYILKGEILFFYRYRKIIVRLITTHKPFKSRSIQRFIVSLTIRCFVFILLITSSCSDG